MKAREITTRDEHRKRPVGPTPQAVHAEHMSGSEDVAVERSSKAINRYIYSLLLNAVREAVRS